MTETPTTGLWIVAAVFLGWPIFVALIIQIDRWNDRTHKRNLARRHRTTHPRTKHRRNP